ncbi:hypothetical protein BLX24_21575 [Arsenicibacter rosenii]|uniref:Restriction endonuclease subunit R n=2 Tax=Arsenicibacter rosenii TaxID=1750698 RepID=A0A1S2VH06_9BACT|nr:hypothetical protein BLX24_21575 [Arsenicibacter rosenii]
MLTLLLLQQCEKLLVIVPTDPLREQIAEKFVSLGILKSLGIINDNVIYPVVGIFSKKISTEQEAKSFVDKCNVIVATASILNKCNPEVFTVFKEHFSHIFIDEAHHSEALTWFKIRDKFSDKVILQFTATPFRNDSKRIDGKHIFNFPLKKAQEEGYYKEIKFKPVYVYDDALRDEKIAELAIEQLREDKKSFKHVLMARAENKNKAEKVHAIYQRYTEFTSACIHSGLSATEKKSIKAKLLKGEIDIIVCVDMLGEGFDYPYLKIAAFHDIRKSLPVTLQFAGRFTRTKRDEELGNATFIASVLDADVKEELGQLYAEDTDWNYLLPRFSEQKTQEEINKKRFFDSFKAFKDKKIPIADIKPALSTVIFDNYSQKWNPSNFRKGLEDKDSITEIYEDLNTQDKVLVFITERKTYIDWGNIKDIGNTTWDLYVVYWDTKTNLLFIHSSDKSSHHQKLAKAIAGENARLLTGQDLFKCFYGIDRLKLQNVGLAEHLGKLIRFIMRVGTDIEQALTDADKDNAEKSVIFGAGYEAGKEVTMGCSYKGRIWSKRTNDLESLITWSSDVGRKVIDKSISVENLLKRTLIPKSVDSIPKKYPVTIDWNDDVYRKYETRFTFTINGINYELYNSELQLVNPDDSGNIRFNFISKGLVLAEFELVLFKKDYEDFKFIQRTPTQKLHITHGKKTETVEEFFYRSTPKIWFVDGSSLEGNKYVKLKENTTPYSVDKIIAWDWSGVNLRAEAQDVYPKITDSIQYFCVQKFIAEDYDIVYDDDYSGEIADVVTIKENSNEIIMELYHLKFAKNGKPAGDIKDLYEVCGQAQKSYHWKHKEPKELFDHMLRRLTKTYKGNTCSRLEKGSEEELIKLLTKVKKSFPLELKVYIVQPGISPRLVTQEQLTLLAVTENHLMKQANIPLTVIGSK